jgi:hypothetical protein
MPESTVTPTNAVKKIDQSGQPQNDISRASFSGPSGAFPTVEEAVAWAVTVACAEFGVTLKKAGEMGNRSVINSTFKELGVRSSEDIRKLKETACSLLGITLPETSVIDGQVISAFPTTGDAERLSALKADGIHRRSSGLDVAETPRELAIFLCGLDFGSHFFDSNTQVSAALLERALYLNRITLETTIIDVINVWMRENWDEAKRPDFSDCKSEREKAAMVLDCADSFDLVDLQVTICGKLDFQEVSSFGDILQDNMDKTSDERLLKILESLETKLRSAGRFTE